VRHEIDAVQTAAGDQVVLGDGRPDCDDDPVTGFFGDPSPGSVQATDPTTLERLFGHADGLLPLWIAEPYVPLAAPIVDALERRARSGWYGYEIRPPSVIEAFWRWAGARHRWDGSDLATEVSPSVGTSIAVLIDLVTEPGDGVIVQPPVFTDFKPIVRASGRTVVTNPLLLGDGGYTMDLDDLTAKAADPATRMLILCNPHNPVGRVWRAAELEAVARICAEHDVVVVSDEIHGDLALAPYRFVPFGEVAPGSGVRWAATHGPLKTFGLAGVCDTLLVTGDEAIRDGFRAMSSRLHLARNNVFGLAAFEAAYRAGGPWLEGMLELVSGNLQLLDQELPDPIGLMPIEGTYLAWLDLRSLGLDVPELTRWLADEARLALSPGHWFGRQGAGFARMSIAVARPVVAEALDRLTAAVERLDRRRRT